MDFIGRLHPLLLHLPIGVLLYAYLHWTYEHFVVKKQQPTNFTFAFALGAVSALVSAFSGWILAKDGGYDEHLLNWHKYLGIATAIGAAALLWLYKKNPSRTSFTLLFTAFILLLTATGHYGGSLTHGEGFLTTAKAETSAVVLENIEEAHLFNDIVMPILDRKCVSCHNPQKAKGDLLLHNLEGLLKGGENGSVIQTGIAAESAIIQRIFLPKEAEEHMPPAGKLQLSNEERNFLRWWVDNMQDYDQQVKDLATTEEVDAYFKSLQENSQPEVDRPSQEQLSSLEDYGIIATRQSSEAPWVDVRLANPTSFEAANLSRLKKIAPAIKSIDLSNATITDTDVDILRRLEYVEKIDLSNSSIGNGVMDHLKELLHLKALNLYGTQIDARIFPDLGELESLEKIYVWETKITDDEAAEWSIKYPDLEIVQGVDFAMFGEPQLVPPFITADFDLFTDSLLVTLDSKAAKARIRYTLDGSNPTENSTIYTEPFYIQKTTEVKGILVMDGWTDSEVISQTFAKSRYIITDLSANVEPNEKYEAEGMSTLTNLKKGSDQFADGNWLGFFGDDLVLTADLGEAREITGVTIGTLTDFTSYIHLPKSITVEVSIDGRRYVPYQNKRLPPIEGPSEAQVHNHLLSAAATEARYLRISIENQQVNPPSHPVPGATCWLFVDEILIE